VKQRAVQRDVTKGRKDEKGLRDGEEELLVSEWEAVVVIVSKWLSPTHVTTSSCFFLEDGEGERELVDTCV